MMKSKVLSGSAKRKKKEEEKQIILKTNKKIKSFFKVDQHEQSKFYLKYFIFVVKLFLKTLQIAKYTRNLTYSIPIQLYNKLLCVLL